MFVERCLLSDVCIGCGRKRLEIAMWHKLSLDQRQAICQMLPPDVACAFKVASRGAKASMLHGLHGLHGSHGGHMRHMDHMGYGRTPAWLQSVTARSSTIKAVTKNSPQACGLFRKFEF